MVTTPSLPVTPMEHDAQRLHGTGSHDASPGELAIGVIIGRASEFFDFFVYAIASVLVFPKLVFPYQSALDATLSSFTIFTLAFLARPIGTFLFTAFERRFGRSAKLIVSLFLLGTTTVAIAFLPGYATIGATSGVCLAIFRLGQGLAWGGTWDGLPSLLSMHVPEKRRGWYVMVPQLGAFVGLIVASGLFAFFVANLAPADFYDWGWRYPFFVAFAINVVALFARLRLVTSVQYAQLFERRELQAQAVLPTLRREGRNILLGSFAPLASFALFHMVTVFPLSWIYLFTQEPPARFLLIEILGAVVGIIASIISGMLADRYGRLTLLGITAGAIAAFSGFAPQMLDKGEAGQMVFMLFGFILLGLSFGQSSGAIAYKFNPTYRLTASALTADLAWLFGAGFAPLAALMLASYFGLAASGAYLLSGAMGTLVALAIANPAKFRN